MSQPEKDLREVFRPEPVDYSKEDDFVPDFDARWLESHNVELVPWTFDKVPFRQRVRCKIGLHRGRVETLGGEICFYCSYCGNITR